MNKDEFIKRGLSDLLIENEIIDIDKEEVIDISLDIIKPNPFQPRRHFDETALNELAESIRVNGVLQPVIVKKVSDGYILVTGERRCRASRIAGFSTVPCIIRDYNSQYLAELALLENVQREDLSIVEEAEAYQNVIKAMNLTHLELATKIGKSRSYISNALGILSLPKEVLEEINKGNITMGHARSLSKLKDVSRIKKISEMIIKEKLTVRDIESLVKKEEKKVKIKRKSIAANFQNELNNTRDYIKETLSFKIPVKVSSNKLIITFNDESELENFKRILGDSNDES